ncbi:MAG: regulatory protein GemA [Firmicutes bacterium]|nr:regulatory protein GemA [Bacillota bacterium]
MAITVKQKALLHIAKTRLGLDDDLYRAILEQEAGVRSSKDLGPEGLDRVLKRLAALGFEARPHEPTLRTRSARRPGELPSAAQMKYIEHLYENLGWYESRRRVGFNRRVVGHPWPQTREEANKVTEALKAMIARGYSRPGREQ